MTNEDKRLAVDRNLRDRLALGVTLTSIVGVIILAILMMVANRQKIDMVFTAVLPLMGSWVGTILAYYFSKDNFEAATLSVSEFAKHLSPQEKLQSTPVKDKMILKNDIFHKTTPAQNLRLIDVMDDLTNGDWSRLPILNDQGQVVYMLHRGDIDRYIAERVRRYPASNLDALSLQDLLNEYGDNLKTSFGLIKETATLADAKAIMDKTPDCKDVFVTKQGKPNEPIIGWITSSIIIENAKV